MLDLAAPVTLPVRLAIRAADDLHTIAGMAQRVSVQIGELQNRADAVLEQLDAALRAALTIERMGQQMLALGERIELRGDALISLGERMEELGGQVLSQGGVIEEAAREVAERGADVAAALPTLQRAVELAQPLEGAVERVGRLVDRLPGGLRERRPPGEVP
jgi:uncharacterized coiled-coil protein SlyX